MLTGGYGLSLLQDFVVGMNYNFIFEKKEDYTLFQHGYGAYARLYTFDGPLRVFGSLELARRDMFVVSDVLTNSYSRASFEYDVGGGLALPVSRMGDPLYLELATHYRSGFRQPDSIGEYVYVSLSFALYM